MTDDITIRLRQTRANMIGTDDCDHYFDCHEAAKEIEKLRDKIVELELRLTTQFTIKNVCIGDLSDEEKNIL
jgi:hypothetical protein